MADPSATSSPDVHRGGKRLPAWDVDTLPEPPRMGWSPVALIGPGLMMAGAAIGGGEWLTGPRNTAQYGGTLMWLAGMSIVLQVFYNLEVIRYAVYSGESIFVGFFRMWPGPRAWTVFYLCVDFFGLWPYLSANAAVPLAAAFLGHVPGVLPTEYGQLTDERIARFAVVSKIEESELRRDLQLVQTRKATRAQLQKDVEAAAKRLEASSAGDEIAAAQKELDRAKKALSEVKPYGLVTSETKDAVPYPEALDKWMRGEKWLVQWLGIAIFLAAFLPLIFGGRIYVVLEKIMTLKIVLVLSYLVFLGIFYVNASAWAEAFGGFVFLSRDYLGSTGGVAEYGPWQFRLFPHLPEGKSLDWALLGAFAAVAGQGGLNNAQFSSYARDKGWGMGQKVGAIPSLIGGRDLRLPHTGSCFEVDQHSLPIWRRWLRVIGRDQWVIWLTGCLLGMAIPSVISLDPQYRDTVGAIGGDATAAATAYALSIKHGEIFWILTLICGFFVLAPNQITATDGLLRRWTEVIWTGSPRLQHLPGSAVRYLYFGLLIAYALWGIGVLLWIGDKGLVIVKIGGCIMNFALGFSAWHTLVVNNTLLPKPVRPNIINNLGLFACGLFFVVIAAVGAPDAIRDAGLGWLIGR